jgi:hypothetical protein
MSDKTGRSDVHPLRRFHSWQVWPGSYDNPRTDRYPMPDGPRPRIDQDTPLAGIGSCFIREMKTRFLAQGFHFLQEEADNPAARHASAAWERLYNLFSVRQVLRYALTEATPRPRWWISPQSGMVQDPYRRIVLYDDLETAEADFAVHRRCARHVLTTARVLVLSLDYVEIWEDVLTGAVLCLPSGPYVVEGGDMSRYRCRTTGMGENLAALEDILRLLRAANPDCHLVLVLSPIQQWATFREETDIFAASCYAKAVLRVAAEEFVARHAGVSYFPAYEMAMLARPALGLPIFAEGRENFHVGQDALDALMAAFFRWYGGQDASAASRDRPTGG